MLQMTLGLQSLIKEGMRPVTANINHKLQQALLDAHRWIDYVHTIVTKEAKCAQTQASTYTAIRSIAGCKIRSASGEEGPLSTFHFSPRQWPKVHCIDGLVDEMNVGRLGAWLSLADNPVWYGLRDEVLTWNATVKAIHLERATFVKGVNKICAHYATVNEALAAWPALRFLLPEDLQTQDFPFNSDPRPLPEGVDIAELTALITRAKLEV